MTTVVVELPKRRRVSRILREQDVERPVEQARLKDRQVRVVVLNDGTRASAVVPATMMTGQTSTGYLSSRAWFIVGWPLTISMDG
jgi:hypothetical protein